MPIPLPSLPETNTSICLVIPDSPQWRQIYMGALQILAQWWYWDVENNEDSQDVVQRVMECAYLTGANYEGCMEIDCQDIIDCINDPESNVLQTILDAVNSQNANQLKDNSLNNKDLIFGSGGNPTCDKDMLWGGIVNLVESANQNNIDALEILEVSTNQYEFLADVLTDILGVEVPVADAMLDWVVWLQQSILENYNAQITQEYLETIQCGLFCIAQDDCELTPDDIYGYFADRIGSSFTFESAIGDVLTYLVAGTWSGTEIADVMFMSQFAFRALVGQWFNFIAFNSIDLDFRLGLNNPDDDWQLLCTDCGWEYTFDFTVSDGGFVADNFVGGIGGNWINGVGWQYTDVNVSAGNYWRSISIKKNFDLSNITNVQLTYNYNLGSPWVGNSTALWIQEYDNSVLGSVASNTRDEMGNGDGQFRTLADDDEVDQINLFLACFRGSSASYNGSCLITALTIEGTGVNPFV